MVSDSRQRLLTIEKHSIVNHQVASLGELRNLLGSRSVTHIDKATSERFEPISEILRLMHRRDMLNTNIFRSHKNYVEFQPRAGSRLKLKYIFQYISRTCCTYHSYPLGSVIHHHCPDDSCEIPDVIGMGV